MGTHDSAELALRARPSNWQTIAARLARDDPAALAELRDFAIAAARGEGRRWPQWRSDDDETVAHDALWLITAHIRSGAYAEQGKFWGYAATIVRRVAAAHRRKPYDSPRKLCARHHDRLVAALRPLADQQHPAAGAYLARLAALVREASSAETFYLRANPEADDLLAQIAADPSLPFEAVDAADALHQEMITIRTVLAGPEPIDPDAPLAAPVVAAQPCDEVVRLAWVKAMQQLVAEGPEEYQQFAGQAIAALARDDCTGWDNALHDINDFAAAVELPEGHTRRRTAAARKEPLQRLWGWMQEELAAAGRPLRPN